ncbi:hypothetical protein I5535_03190 [Rhodobacteraceae bacterium F11138]|nr:hypothetical protein [Rhodobacteraceae bacterium F11138]
MKSDGDIKKVIDLSGLKKTVCDKSIMHIGDAVDFKKTIRTGELAILLGRTKASVRGDLARGVVPWDDDGFETNVQRRYDGQHVVAGTVLEMAQGAGLTAIVASPLVQRQWSYIGAFFDRLDAGKRVNDMNIVFKIAGTHDDLHGFGYSEISYGCDPTEAGCRFNSTIEAFFSEGISNRDVRFNAVKTGVAHFSVVNLLFAYRYAKERALAKGYVLRGRDILKAKKAAPIGADLDASDT